MAAKMAAIINMKGGVGKTTLSFNLAHQLAHSKGKRVLLVDLDPQANATLVSTDPAKYAEHCKSKKTVADIFIHAFRTYGPIVSKTPKPIELADFVYPIIESGTPVTGKFDLIPSELMLSSVLKGMTLGPYDLDRLVTQQVREEYDYILIDCAPTYSSLTTIALNSAQAVLVPMVSDSFGVHGTKLMKTVLKEHEHDFNVKPRLVGVLFTLWEGQVHEVEYSNTIVKEWDAGDVFSSKISKNNWYRVANGRREALVDTPAHADVKDEFAKFVAEFVTRA